MRTVRPPVTSLLCLLAVTTVALSADRAQLRIGDRSPILPPLTYVLGDAPPAVIDPDRITVIEFWASWCPTSRLVLSRQDSLAATEQFRNIDFVAITQEDATATAEFVERAGWRNLTIGCDPDREALRAFFDPAVSYMIHGRTFPFAFIIGSDIDRGSNTILWIGRVADSQAENPVGAFETTLNEAVRGACDLSAALEILRQEERSIALFGELYRAKEQDDLDTLERGFDELTSIQIWRPFENTLVHNMNNFAWEMAVREEKTERHLELAFRAIEIARAAGGDSNSYFVDTHARVLYEAGRVAEAAEVQERALELAKGTGDEVEFREILKRYRRAAGLPEEEPKGGVASVEESPEPWSGTIGEIFRRFDHATEMLVVRPSFFADSAAESNWIKEMDGLTQGVLTGCPVRRPEGISAEDRSERVLILYGTPASNPITQEVLDRHQIEIRPGGVRVVDLWLRTEHPVLIAGVPNPLNPSLPVLICTSLREEDALAMNGFLPGPTALVFGRRENGMPNALHSLDFETDSGRNGIARTLALAPQSLTREEAIEDLQRLHVLLSANYAGYPDLDWNLRLEGSSWSERTAEFAERIEEREIHEWTDFFDLLREYLAPVQDVHFNMRGTGIRADTIWVSHVRFFQSLVPYFTDVVVQSDRAAKRIVEAGEATRELYLSELVDVEIIGTPRTARAARPYLFPTLPREASMASALVLDESWLLGLLADPDDPPERLEVMVKDHESGSELREVELPLHRGRMKSPERGLGWSVSMPPESRLPTLAVRTMDTDRLHGMAESADSLRDLSRLILDLRRNPGGSDRSAMEWCQRFSSQSYMWHSSVAIWPNQSDPFGRWMSRVGELRSKIAGENVPQPEQPYGGELIVLVDKGVASSGETFRMLAAQVEGAVTVGENTAGCVSYGNVRLQEPLPNSKIRFSFGWTKFVVDWVEPSGEGIGFFPYFWLDTEDPIEVIAAHLGQRSQ